MGIPARLLTVIFLLTFAIGANGQDVPPFNRVIKIYPIQLYKIFPTATVAYEHRISNKLSVIVEASPFLNLSIIESDYTNKKGIRFREELRYYFRYKYPQSKPTYARGIYGEVDLHQTSASYFEHSERVEWREAGFGIKFGMAENLNRVVLDYSLGVSFRYAKVTPPDLWASMVNFWEERYPIVQPTVSIGIGYRLE